MRSFVKLLLVKWGQMIARCPRYVVRAPGALLGFLWIDFLRVRKKVVLENLRLAFPEKSEADRLLIARRSVYNMGYNFAEFFAIPGMDKEWRQHNIVFHGLEHIQQAQAENKGVFILGMHLGNGDIIANAIASDVTPLVLITKVFKNKILNDIWFSIRGYHGVKYIDAHGSNNAFEILKALKQKSAVVFVLDQFMGRPFGIPTQFFGKRTGTAYGLALFVQKTKAPVIPVYSYDGEDGKIHIVFLPKVDTGSLMTDDKDETTARMTQKFTDIIEDCVRRHPEHWMWVHRRWKNIE